MADLSDAEFFAMPPPAAGGSAPPAQSAPAPQSTAATAPSPTEVPHGAAVSTFGSLQFDAQGTPFYASPAEGAATPPGTGAGSVPFVPTPPPTSGASQTSPLPTTALSSKPAAVLSDAEFMGMQPPADDYLAGMRTPPSPSGSGILPNLAAGIGDTMLLPTELPDPVHALLKMGVTGINSLTGLSIPGPRDTIGPNYAKVALGKIGLNPDDVKAATPGEYAARGVGSMLPFIAAPYLAPEMAGITSLPSALPGALKGIGMGAAQGLGQFAGERLAPQGYEGLGGFAGGLFGGIAADLGPSLASTVGLAAKQQVVSAFPVTQGMQQQAAALRIAGAATDLPAVRATLGSLPAPDVPGSMQSTAAVTGDRGLAGLQRAVTAQNPAPWLQKAADQNRMQVKELTSIPPAEADPYAVGDYVRSTLAGIDAANDAAIAGAVTGVQSDTAAVAGNMKPEAYGEGLRGTQETGGQLATARGDVKTVENRLWYVIDPTKDATMDVSPLPSAFAKIKSQIRGADAVPDGEAALYDLVSSWPDVQSYQEVKALRSTIGNNMATELRTNGRTPAWGRMRLMQQATNDTIGSAVERAAGKDYSPSSTSFPQPQSAEATLQTEATQWKQNQLAARNSQVQAGGDASASSGGLDASGQSGFPSAPGDQGQAGTRSGPSPGNPSLQSQPDQGASVLGGGHNGGPTWTDQQTASDAAARAFSANRIATFDSPRTNAVGKALRPDGRGGFMMADEQVGARFFNSGERATQDMQDFMRAVGDRPKAVALLQDYAASQLRAAAINSDGTFNVPAYEKWRDNHEAALRAFPELMTRFRSAAQSQQTLDIVQATAKWARDSFTKSAARFALDNQDPTEMIRQAMSGRPEVIRGNMENLAAKVEDNPDARDGLQRALITFLVKRFANGNGEVVDEATGARTLSGAAFRKFFEANRPAMLPVLGQSGVTRVQNVVRDIEKAQWASQGSKIPGGSNTTQDTQAILNAHAPDSILAHMTNEMSGNIAILAVLKKLRWPGAMAAMAAKAFARQGVARVDQLVAEAMQNPEVAKVVLTKLPASRGAQINWLRQVMRMGVTTAAVSGTQSKQGAVP